MTDWIKIGACLRTPEVAHYMAISKSRLTPRMSAPGHGGWRRPSALELALGSRPQSDQAQRAAR